MLDNISVWVYTLIMEKENFSGESLEDVERANFIPSKTKCCGGMRVSSLKGSEYQCSVCAMPIRENKKEKVCRFGHICTSDCQNTKDCPCLADHCCEMSESVCDRTCDDCYFLAKELKEDRKSAEKELFDVVYQWGRVGVITDENSPTFQKLVANIRMI